MHEHIVHVLSLPHSVARHITITINERPLELAGWPCSHWAALCFVTQLASDNRGILSQLRGWDDDVLDKVKERCDVLLQQQFWNGHASTLCSRDRCVQHAAFVMSHYVSWRQLIAQPVAWQPWQSSLGSHARTTTLSHAHAHALSNLTA